MAKQVFIVRPGNTTSIEEFMSVFMARDSEKTWKITFEEYRKNRTIAQNSLMWLWHTEKAKQVGEDKNTCHEHFKYRHVLPILLRDSEDDEDIGLIEIYDHAKVNPKVMKTLVNLISTTHLDTKQFTEALEEYDRRTAVRYEFAFSHPEDTYREAMGARK